MKYIAAVCTSFLLTCSIVSVFPNVEECKIYDDVLRLHVIAESDSEEDQALKLKVRDAVLGCVTELVADCGSFDEAYAVVSDNLKEIKTAAVECIKNNGYDYDLKAELVRENYPRRDYGAAVIPAGVYNSLKITIGSGEGHNWWCVLFPSICTRFASAYGDEYIAAGFTPEEYRIITGEGGVWKVKFRFLEILSSLKSIVEN